MLGDMSGLKRRYLSNCHISGAIPAYMWQLQNLRILFERMLNEMLNHLERQPRDEDRRISWLKFIEPLFNAVGLVLLAHFRCIFALFFQWMHTDDDETVLLMNELVALYKETEMRKAREEIRTDVLQILILLQQCKGQQFGGAWDKHMHDPNLTTL